MHYHFVNNVCMNVGGCCVWTGSAASAKILGNDIEGYGSAGTYDNAIKIGYLSTSIHIADNRIRDVGAPASSTMVELDWPVTMHNNHLSASGNADYGVRTVPSGVVGFFTSIENRIIGNAFGGPFAAAVRIAANSNYLWNGSLVAQNRFFGADSGDIGVEVEEADGVVIDGNTFGGDVTFDQYIGRAIYVHGTGVAGAPNTQIINNHFKNVAGASGSAGAPRVVEVAGDGDSCHNTLIANNHFQECGAWDTSHYPVGNNAAVIWVYNAPNFQIRGNHISQLRGYSATADNNDTFYGIYVYGQPGQIDGNYIEHRFNVGGYVADTMYGIYIATAQRVAITNNRIHWSGTQGGANNTDVAVAIECGSNDRLLVNSNLVTGSWSIPGVTTSRAIWVGGDLCAVVGNAADGSAGAHDIWVGGAAGVVIGNVAMGANSVTWNTGTNQPSDEQYCPAGNTVPNTTRPYQDMNVGAVSHG
jgi:hypothetical protein